MNWFYQKRPLVVTACCVSVSNDQVLWYVDLAGQVFTGKFPNWSCEIPSSHGSKRYGLWIDKLTCTHHLWCIPVSCFMSIIYFFQASLLILFYSCFSIVIIVICLYGADELCFDAYLLSAFVVAIYKFC